MSSFPRRVGALLAVACAAALGLSAQASAAVPDPLAAGPHPVQELEYDAGTLLVNLPTAGQTTSVPMRGSVTYPTDADQSRIVVLVHGRHGVCIGTPPAGEYTCDDTTTSDGTPVETDVRSYAGYDYLARNLASNGYVVMSIEANVTNFDNGYADAGANVRSQIIQASLQLLYRWNNGAGPVVAGDPEHTIGTKLVGRLDFSDGLGLMGHSRGGDAVTDFIAYNRGTTGTNHWTLDGVLALAPTNYTSNKTPTGTNYGMLLPGCDGDVSTLQGARLFENAKYAAGSDGFAKTQWFVQGANHNFFNTVWTGDDFGPTTDPACTRGTATSKRLEPSDQRRVGIALMGSFLRRYVGDETAFQPLVDGEVTYPEAAAPKISGVGVGELVKTSFIAPAAQRLDVLRPTPTPDPVGDPAAPVDPTATTVDAAGGPISTTGVDLSVCRPAAANGRGLPVVTSAYPACPDDSQNRSVGTQFTLGWTGPGTLRAGLGAGGAARDVSAFGTLAMRVSTIRGDARNAPGDATTPDAVTQDLDVTLVDAAGATATTNAARWGTSLEPSIGTSYVHDVLNGLRIPLSAFPGVDLTKVVAVQLGVGTRTPSGAIHLADVAFQEPAAPPVETTPPTTSTPTTPTTTVTTPGATVTTPATTVTTPGATTTVTTPAGTPPATTAPAVAPSPLPGPVIGTPAQLGAPAATAAASASACTDATAPRTSLTRVTASRRTLRVSGLASDVGCPGTTGTQAGGVKRTVVEVWRVAGDRCRFVSARGRLRAAAPCDTPVGLYAKGTASWSLAIAGARLPTGTYHVRVTTYDRAGNATRRAVRRTRVAKGR